MYVLYNKNKYKIGGFIMNTDIKKKIAYELTLEYIRQNNTFRTNGIAPPYVFDKFDEIYSDIYNSLKDKNL